MVAIFLALEAGVRLMWSPVIIGEKPYMFVPRYDYGFDESTPLFYAENNSYTCYPTQYAQIWKQSLPKRRLEDETRIFVIGASVSRGKMNANYPKFLETALNGSYPARKWRVMNISVVGIGSARMMVLLKKTIGCRPDMFIYHVHGSNEYEDERDEACRNKMSTGITGVIFSSRALVLAKKYLDWKNPAAGAELSVREDEKTANKKTENISRWNARIKNNLTMMLQIARDNKVPVILMGRAVKDITNDRSEADRTRQVNDITRSLTDSSEIFYFDTNEILHSTFIAGTDTRGMFEDQIHYTKQGHLFIAGKLRVLVHEIFRLQQSPHPSQSKPPQAEKALDRGL